MYRKNFKKVKFSHPSLNARTLDYTDNTIIKYTRKIKKDTYCDTKFLVLIKGPWVVIAEEHEDYYTWINYFRAYRVDNPNYFVRGDFEQNIYAFSKEIYIDFMKYFSYTEWDYLDI